MRILALSAFAFAATAAPAFAQDAAPFTGPRAEIVGGWDHAGGLGDGESGFAYGGAIGYDAQLSSAVIGVEAELTGATTEGSGISAGRDIFVGGRIGFVAGASTLVYGKAGYTNARASLAGAGADFDGYRFGAGVEHSFGRFYGKVEYRYARYEEIDLNRDQVVAGIGIRF